MAEFKPIETQEELDKIIQARLEREKTKYAEDIAQLQAKNESENKKALEELQKRIEGYEKAELKRKVAIDNGIPYSLADRIQGDDEEAMTKDAKSLAEFLTPPSTAPLKSVEPEVKDKKLEAYSNLAKNIFKGE